jgi:hypothetical protein
LLGFPKSFDRVENVGEPVLAAAFAAAPHPAFARLNGTLRLAGAAIKARSSIRLVEND